MANFVYKIVNKENGKVYVGSTIRGNKREKEHLLSLRQGNHHSILLQRAWNKYGEEKFEFIIIEELSDPKIVIKREQYWINYYESYNPKYGYNICPTAGSRLGAKNSPEVNAKLSVIHKNRCNNPKEVDNLRNIAKNQWKDPEFKKRMILEMTSPERRAKLRESLSSAKTRSKMSRSHKGLKVSPETKAKMSASAKKRCANKKKEEESTND